MSLTADEIMRHYPSLVGVAKTKLPTHSHMVWEDLASDTIVKAWTARDRYQERGSGPFSWLARIMQNVVIDYTRAQAGRAHQPLAEYGMGRIDAGSERHLDHLLAEDILSRLDEPARSTLTLRYRDGLYFAQLAASRTNGFNRHKRAIQAARAVATVQGKAW